MARRQKPKNDITKYAIIGIVALVLIFLVMNVGPTGKFTDPGKESFAPGEGMLMQEEDGSFLCYTFESRLEESCAVKDLDGLAMSEDPCNCFTEEMSEGMPGEREEPREEMMREVEEGPEEFEEPEPESVGIY